MGKGNHMHERFDQTKRVRVDKWIWAVRILKSRTEATQWCGKGWVEVNGEPCKASRMVKMGDMVRVRRSGFGFEYKVLGVLEKRVSVELANECKEWVNEAEYKTEQQLRRDNAVIRTVKGEAREMMTKKEKRERENMKSGGSL